MLKNTKAFSGFSVDDIDKAREFYGKTLGLNIHEENGMGIVLHISTGADIFVYPKENHEPAEYTVLNFPVDNIDAAMDVLKAKGITFEHYSDMPVDEKGVLRGLSKNMGPDIAWFKDPAGNVLSVLQERR